MENMDIALVLLLAGLVIVFVMLILLTLIIKGYSAIVRKALHKSQVMKTAEGEKKNEVTPVPAASKMAPAAMPAVQQGIPGEVVAAIAGAVDYLYGEGQAAVVGIQRAGGTRRRSNVRTIWGTAGLLENTRPF